MFTYLIFWNIRFYILCGITDIACGKMLHYLLQ